MLRDIWVVLLFVGGLFLGGAAAFVYHHSASTALSKEIVDREKDIERLETSLSAEQLRAKAAIEQQEQLRRDLDVVQLQLAEQTALVARQRERIAELEVIRPDAEPAPKELELSEPSNKEDGIVRGGQFVYRHVKLQPSNDELEIAGEMENRTDTHFREVIFHIELFDDRQQPIDTIAVTMVSLPPGETKPFKELTLADKPRLIRAATSFRITAALIDGK